MFPLQFDIVYFCKFFAFYTFWFIIHQILAKIKILNKSNALKILIFSVLQKYIWTRNICTAISALIPFLFGTAASTIIPKQSNCVCEKPQTDFAGNTGCPLLKSPANGSRFSCNSMSKCSFVNDVRPKKSERVASFADRFCWRKEGVARLESAKPGGLQLLPLLKRRFPVENGHGNAVGSL